MNSSIAQDSLKIMTYNLEGMKPGTDPQTRIYHTIQYLKQLNPDIIGLQEINESPSTGSDNQAQMIVDSLTAYFGYPFYKYIGFTHLSWDNQFNEYVGIITKHPAIEVGYFDLVKGAFPRKILWNRINTPLGMINFFNTHLDHKTPEIRVQQVQEIISYVNQKDLSSPAIASVLTGDFNDEPHTSTIQSLTNTGSTTYFNDSYRIANPTLQGYTSSSQIPNRRIDYIFFKNTGQLSITSSRVVMDQPYVGIEYPSDHYGVMTIFTKKVARVAREINSTIPVNMELRQNYPNPFNPTTTIHFTIPSTSFVTLKVYDMLGREISSLVNEEKSAGNYQEWFDANGLSSGIYMYKITACNSTISKRMMLMK
ncbi:MAG: endonuclease/exonuclease/phosphatase family protein [Bacteroidota bacterium]